MWSDFKQLYAGFLVSLIITAPSFAQSSCDIVAQRLKTGDLLNIEEILANAENCPNIVGQVYLRKGNNNKAENYFNTALNNATDQQLKAAALNNLGLVYWNTGNVKKGMEFVQESLELRVGEFGEKHELTAASYNDMGLIMSAKDPEMALVYYEKALKIYQSIFGAEDEKTIQASINTGISYRNLGYYGEATVTLEEALMQWKKLYPAGHPNEAFILTNIGQNLQATNSLQDALASYELALEVYLKFYGNEHPEVASTYNLIGNIYNVEGEFEESLSYYQKAIISNVPGFDEIDIEINPATSSYLNSNTLLNSLYYKSKALMDLHFNKTLKFNDLKLSLSTLQSCDSLIDNIRKIRTNESDKLALGQLSSTVYETGVELCKAMGDVAVKKDDFYELSLYFAEKSKSAVLLEAIADSNAKSFAGLDESDLLLENAFKNDIAYLENQIVIQSNAEFRKNLQSELLVKRTAYEELIKSIETKYPEYFKLKYSTILPSLEELQSELTSNQMLLTYFVSDISKRLYIYEITQKKLKLISKAVEDNFDQYLSGYKNSIFFKVKDTYQLTAVELHDLLIPKKIDKEIDHLIIIPSGRLGTIPFEALLTDKIKNEPSYSELPYLVNSHKISYTYSSALLSKRTSTNKQTEAFLCAPVTFNSLPSLPGTEQELNQLGDILSSRNITSNSFLLADASEELIKNQNFNNYKYVHLATHGVVDAETPALSRIFLNSGGNEDGSLYTGEIYNLNLGTELVTLSACETGLGKLSKGEGVIGLSRALLYAGAENVLVSLWAVSDTSTANLMTDFYSSIVNENYSQALQEAKKSLINSDGFSEPYYWAPFILIGQ